MPPERNCARIAASTALVASWRSSLSFDLRGRVQGATVGVTDLLRSVVDRDRLEDFLLLADFRGEVALECAQLLDLGVGDVQRVEISASGISLAPASTIRIASSVPATIRSRSELLSASARRSSWEGLTTKLPSILPMRCRRRRQRDVGDDQRRGGAVHREDVIGVHVVDRQRDRDEPRVIASVLGKQRADRRSIMRAVSAPFSRGGGALGKNELGPSRRRTCAPLTSTVSGRKSTSRRRAGDGCREHDRVRPGGTTYCAGRPAPAISSSQRRSRYQRLHGDPCNGSHYSYSLPSCSARRSAVRFYLSLFRTKARSCSRVTDPTTSARPITARPSG